MEGRDTIRLVSRISVGEKTLLTIAIFLVSGAALFSFIALGHAFIEDLQSWAQQKNQQLAPVQERSQKQEEG